MSTLAPIQICADKIKAGGQCFKNKDDTWPKKKKKFASIPLPQTSFLPHSLYLIQLPLK